MKTTAEMTWEEIQNEFRNADMQLTNQFDCDACLERRDIEKRVAFLEGAWVASQGSIGIILQKLVAMEKAANVK